MSNLIETELQNIAQFYNGKSTKLSEHGLYDVYGANGVIGKSDEAKYENSIIIGRVGAYCGAVTYCENKFNASDNTIIATNKGDCKNIKFLYYLLKFINLNKYAGGAAQPLLTQSVLNTVKVLFNDNKDVQDKIAKILSNYDDLIENNNKRIKILEEMAQKIYKEWFVDFKYPSHEEGKFAEIELGKLVMPKKGKNITKATIRKGSVPVVAGGLEPAYYHNVANTASPVITVSASGANAGYVKLYYEDIWASDCSYIDSKITPYVYYFYSYLKYNQIKVTNLQKGAAQPHVYPQDLASLKLFDIDAEIVKQFNVLVTPTFEEIKNITSKNTILRQTRDLLLPRLMSGEISVENLEKS